MAGVDLGYDTDGLRQGGREALGAGQVASGAAGILRGATCPATALGVVAGAEALAAARSVPAPFVRLLPAGPALDPEAAAREFTGR